MLYVNVLGGCLAQEYSPKSWVF